MKKPYQKLYFFGEGSIEEYPKGVFKRQINEDKYYLDGQDDIEDEETKEDNFCDDDYFEGCWDD